VAVAESVPYTYKGEDPPALLPSVLVQVIVKFGKFAPLEANAPQLFATEQEGEAGAAVAWTER
jgi:hypothetical protein